MTAATAETTTTDAGPSPVSKALNAAGRLYKAGDTAAARKELERAASIANPTPAELKRIEAAKRLMPEPEPPSAPPTVDPCPEGQCQFFAPGPWCICGVSKLKAEPPTTEPAEPEPAADTTTINSLQPAPTTTLPPWCEPCVAGGLYHRASQGECLPAEAFAEFQKRLAQARLLPAAPPPPGAEIEGE